MQNLSFYFDIMKSSPMIAEHCEDQPEEQEDNPHATIGHEVANAVVPDA